jgi:hypothetical protein
VTGFSAPTQVCSWAVPLPGRWVGGQVAPCWTNDLASAGRAGMPVAADGEITGASPEAAGGPGGGERPGPAPEREISPAYCAAVSICDPGLASA